MTQITVCLISLLVLGEYRTIAAQSDALVVPARPTNPAAVRSHSDPDAARAVFSTPGCIHQNSGAAFCGPGGSAWDTPVYSWSTIMWEWPWFAAGDSVRVDLATAPPDALLKIVDGDRELLLDAEMLRKLLKPCAAK